MGRNLSPVVRRELENLDQEGYDRRKSAIKGHISHINELDSNSIFLFLAKISEIKETNSSDREHTLSLYEVLVRLQGQKIIPLIDNIMNTVIKTMSSCQGSLALHQACSKVVLAVARYGMDPITQEYEKKYVIHSLCKPLSDCLLGSDEYLSSGSALCLKALVECDNWKFASKEMVNEVCQKVTAALDKHVHTNSHMALVMSLAKHNSLILEAYARLLISSGLQTMDKDVDSYNRLSAIHMVNCLMKCLDLESIISELGRIIKAMDSYQFDPMAYVCEAAAEALQTARKISIEKGSKFERDNCLMKCSLQNSNADKRREIRRRNFSSNEEQSSTLTASPESHTVDSIFHDALFDSPHSTNQISPEFSSCRRRSLNQKLWSRCQNGAIDISLDDNENFQHKFISENCGNYSDESASPQIFRSEINVDSVKIYTTPRKLFESLQDPNDEIYESPGSQFQPTPTSNQNLYYVNYKINTNEKPPYGGGGGGEEHSGSSESVSSTQDKHTETTLHQPKTNSGESKGSIRYKNPSVYSLFIVFAVLVLATIFFYFWIDESEGDFLVPT